MQNGFLYFAKMQNTAIQYIHTICAILWQGLTGGQPIKYSMDKKTDSTICFSSKTKTCIFYNCTILQSCNGYALIFISCGIPRIAIYDNYENTIH
jgi:hypothetical protein